MVEKTGLDDLTQLRDHIFFFEEVIVFVDLRYDKDTFKGIQEVVKDFVKVGGLVKRCSRGKNVFLEYFQEKLDVKD